jgi:hypothetical protein
MMLLLLMLPNNLVALSCDVPLPYDFFMLFFLAIQWLQAMMLLLLMLLGGLIVPSCDVSLVHAS